MSLRGFLCTIALDEKGPYAVGQEQPMYHPKEYKLYEGGMDTDQRKPNYLKSSDSTQLGSLLHSDHLSECGRIN